MSTLARIATASLALVAGGCVKLDTFACAQSSECVHDGLAGTCEAAGVCSFPDTSCPSGKKFGEFAGEQAGQCVDAGGTTGTPTSGGGTGTDASGPTSGSTTTATTVDPDTTVDPSQVSVTTVDPTDSPETTVDPTTGGPACVGLGEACADVPCCSPCMTCESGVCVAAAAEAGPAACGGVCFECGPDGECAAKPEMTACKANCDQVVWQSSVVGAQTGCHSYAPLEVDSVCDAAGQCVLPAVAACPDPTLMPGPQFVACDTVCLGDAAASLCVSGAPAAAVTLGSYCATNVETTGCQDLCTLDSAMMPAVDDAACDGLGVCVHSLETCTGGLKCDEVETECPSKCMDDADCVSGNCQGTKCM